MAKPKKLPERRCVGCGNSFQKRELVRIVKDKDGTVSLDLTGKKAGRGVYICKNDLCFKKAIKAKRFESNLGCALPEDLISEIAAELERNGNE